MCNLVIIMLRGICAIQREGNSLTKKLTIVGLGPGGRDLLPSINLEILRGARRLFLRTEIHPVVDWIKQQQITYESFDKFYDSAEDFDEVYRLIVNEILVAVNEEEVVYAVPGHPLVAETAVEMILQEAQQRGIHTNVVPAMSFLDAIYAALNINPVRGLQIFDGLQLDKQVLNPSLGVIVVQVYSRLVAADIKLSLLDVYPAEHQAVIVQAAGMPGEERIEFMSMYEIDRLDWVDHLTTLYIPPLRDTVMKNKGQFLLDPLVNIMSQLRGEKGCPWDKEQDHDTLTPYLLEETYEVLEAIQQENMYNICEELGDLLLQIVFHAQIARERGYFDINDVLDGICNKMIDRHPHVFGDLQVKDSSQVLENWEKIKQKEKDGDSGREREKSVLDGVPRGLPALLRAYKIQKRAARVGFDWPNYKGALDKIEEELLEFKEALEGGQRKNIELETGDMLFAVVNVARQAGIDPEVALVAATDKFIRRFQYIEQNISLHGKNMNDMTLADLDLLWEQAKKNEE